MRASQFEIYRLVQRAMEALGAGFGVDRDAARTIAWLEARGLPGLAAFARDLPALERGLPFPALARPSPGTIFIDGGEGSTIAFAGAAIDLLAAEAKANGSARLVCRCSSPLFLIPSALEIAFGRFLAIGWQSAEGAVSALIAGDGAVSIHAKGAPEAALLAPVASETVVETAATPLPAPAGLAQALEPGALTERHVRSLNEGVEVSDALWKRLNAVAARVQVPASSTSRERGAGGGDANI
jgi:hypothetical protein